MMAQALKLSRDYGVIISDVEPGTPAAKAGLMIGDILLSLDDHEISSLPMLQGALYTHPSEMPADVEVLRGEQKLSFEFNLLTHTHALDQLATATQPQQVVIRQLGVVAATVDQQVVTMVGRQLREPSGALVVARTIAAAAIDSDLQPGDIIHTLNLTRVTKLEELLEALSTVHPGDFVVMQIERQGQLQFMTSEVD